MSEREQLVQLGQVLAQVARPHGCEDRLSDEVQASLWQLGFPCGEKTSREELIARLWARKRSLLLGMPPDWSGPGATPPSAA